MGDGMQRSGLHHLPFRIRDSSYQNRSSPKDGAGVVAAPGGGVPPASTIRKRFPDSLSLLSSDTRLRSPTESSMSSVPDSATSYSHSTVASPLSSSYTSDLQDFICSSTSSRPHSRVRHRHQPSTGTCSTFVNDDDDAILVVPGGYPEYGAKVRETVMMLPGPIGADTDDETAPVSPMTEGPLDDEDEKLKRKLKRFSNCTAKDLKLEPDVAPEAPEDQQQQQQDHWDTASTVSNDNCSAEDVDLILDYTLQLAYGVDINDTTVKRPESRQLVQKFIQELGQSIWHGAPETYGSNTNSNNNNNAMSTSVSSSSTPAGSTGDSQRGGKRKKQSTGRAGGDEEAEDFSDGEGNGGGDGYQAVKRPKPNPREDDNLRLSCPFRKRNPHRFNVRDHHSCSLTYFPKFSELRWAKSYRFERWSFTVLTNNGNVGSTSSSSTSGMTLRHLSVIAAIATSPRERSYATTSVCPRSRSATLPTLTLRMALMGRRPTSC
jgi:hypothetical protein